MSTPFSAGGSPGETGFTPSLLTEPARDGSGDHDGPGDQTDSAEALAIEIAAFASAFDHWSNRKAIEAGASIPRLRLLYAVHCHGPQKMADLAEALAVTPRNVTALVDGLESEGLVRRVPHATDRRVTLVELTCNAQRVESQFQTYQASIASLFDSLDAGDRLSLQRLLRTLHDRMHADIPPAGSEVGTPDA